MKSYTASHFFERTLVYITLMLIFIAAVIPFFWMVLTSIKSGGGIFSYPPEWLPKEVTLEWYKQLFHDVDFTLHFKNSLIVSITTTFFNLFFCSLAGYAFAKLKFAGRTRIFTLLMATLMIPGQI